MEVFMVKEWKRFMFLLLILAVGVCVFTGCGKSPSNEESSQVSEEKEKKEETLSGTWEPVKAEVEGSIFTIDELENMGDNSLDGFILILKDGGKAYVKDQQSEGIIDWKKNGEKSVAIGVKEMTIENNCIILENNGVKLFLEKTSDSQEIPGE